MTHQCGQCVYYMPKDGKIGKKCPHPVWRALHKPCNMYVITNPRKRIDFLQAENEKLKKNQMPEPPICRRCRKPRKLLEIVWSQHAVPCKE